MTTVPITAAHVAVALVAACGVTETPPEDAFELGNQRPRVMAAATCIARLGWDRKASARVFRVHPNRLTPSGLRLARVETEDLLTVAEALAAQGLVAPAGEPAAPPHIGPPGPARRIGSVAANPVRARKPDWEVTRLKPLTQGVIRWARQQVDRGADLAFVAWCFEVDAEALADALKAEARPGEAVAA